MLRVIGHLYPAEAPVLHFNMFRAPVIPDLDPTSFSPGEQKALQRSDEFTKYGRGYNDIQSTKVSVFPNKKRFSNRGFYLYFSPSPLELLSELPPYPF